MGTGGSFPENKVKSSGHEADHSRSRSVEVKNVWGYTYTPHKS